MRPAHPHPSLDSALTATVTAAMVLVLAFANAFALPMCLLTSAVFGITDGCCCFSPSLSAASTASTMAMPMPMEAVGAEPAPPIAHVPSPIPSCPCRHSPAIPTPAIPTPADTDAPPTCPTSSSSVPSAPMDDDAATPCAVGAVSAALVVMTLPQPPNSTAMFFLGAVADALVADSLIPVLAVATHGTDRVAGHDPPSLTPSARGLAAPLLD